MLRVPEEPVFGKEPGEEHPVPVFVSDFVDEMFQLLGALPPIVLVADLAAAHPKSVSECPVPERHRFKGLCPIDGE